MRRTLIAAASAATLATAASGGFAIAQQQAPARQETQSGHHRAAEEGAMQGRQSAQAESSGEQRMRKKSVEKLDQKAKPERSPDENRANQAETEKMKGEQPAEAQGAQNDRQADKADRVEKTKVERENRSAEAKKAAQEKDKAAADRNATDANRKGEARTDRNHTQNPRSAVGENPKNGKGDDNARAETHVTPQSVQARGNAHLTNDRAAKVANTIMATATPQDVNVNIVVGQPLPGQVRLMPLPPTIVELVPEYRDYDYVVVNDEVAIVQPSTRHVVEVIDTGGGVATNGGEQAMAGTRLNPCGTP